MTCTQEYCTCSECLERNRRDYAVWRRDLPGVAAQPPPAPNNRPAVVDLVLIDLKERDALGTLNYGTRLQPHNGRDALVDAYQEALDLAIYLRQVIEERK